MSYAHAKAVRARLYRINAHLNAVAEPISARLGLCGNGRRHNWSVLIADALFVDCACCLVWRGLAIGFLIGAVAGAGLASII